jgi:pimeloyl-ACP methyl ester carboxylesterase
MFRAFMLAAAALLAQPALAAFASDRIAVTTEGAGPDVVLVHGLASSARVWKGMVERVPGYRYHLVQIAGMSAVPPGGNAQGAVVAPVAEEIARYIREEKLAKPALIGHSMGGTIGMMFGAMDAEKARPIADAMRARSARATPEERAAERERTINSMINTVAERTGPLEDSLATNPDTAANAFSELIVTDLRPELPAIKAPTTVLYVTPKGAPFTDAQMDGFYTAAYAPISGATLKRVPNAAHFIMLDAPDAFASEVKAFLER